MCWVQCLPQEATQFQRRSWWVSLVEDLQRTCTSKTSFGIEESLQELLKNEAEPRPPPPVQSHCMRLQMIASLLSFVELRPPDPFENTVKTKNTRGCPDTFVSVWQASDLSLQVHPSSPQVLPIPNLEPLLTLGVVVHTEHPSA